MRKIFVIALAVAALGFIYHIVTPMTVPQELGFYHHFTRKAANVLIRTFKPDSAFNLLPPQSDVPLDVIIPVVEKDLDTLPHVVASVRGLVMHPITNIYVVAPSSDRIRQKAQELNITYVEESTVIPPIRQQEKLSGWFKQQYIKLNGDQIAQNEHFMVLDSDTLFVRPQVFIEDGKVVFNTHRDYTLARKHFVQKAFGFHTLHNMCFTVHHMVFEKSKLKAMRTFLEQRHQKPWYDALNELEGVERRGLSEFELYANYVLTEYPETCKIQAAFNVELGRDRLPYLEGIRAAVASQAKTLSFHLFA